MRRHGNDRWFFSNQVSRFLCISSARCKEHFADGRTAKDVKKIDHDLNAAREAGVLAHFGITLISAETELNFDGCKGFSKRPLLRFAVAQIAPCQVRPLSIRIADDHYRLGSQSSLSTTN